MQRGSAIFRTLVAIFILLDPDKLEGSLAQLSTDLICLRLVVSREKDIRTAGRE